MSPATISEARYSLLILDLGVDDTEKVKLIRPDAEAGIANAQNSLGCHYYNGRGVPTDYKEAAKWYRLAAEKGDACAQNNLGDCYGFFAVAPIIDGKHYADWILEPDWIRYQNHRLYRVVIGGILYMFAVSSHPLKLPHPNLFIQKTGEWIIQHRDVRQIEFLRQWLNEAGKAK